MSRSRRRRIVGATALAVLGLVGSAAAGNPAGASRSVPTLITGERPPLEEPGDDMGNSDADPVDAGAQGDAVGEVPASVPSSPTFGLNTDPLQPYVGQSTCDPTVKPGVADFRDLLLRTYSNSGSLGITRDCSIGGASEHKEGRAFDWQISAADPSQHATADRLLAWLLATDANGFRWSQARHFGIMYMIWDRKVWKAYKPLDGWQPYTGTNPHTDHVHFSFSWPGAMRQTTWWNPAASGGPLEQTAVGTRADFDANGVQDAFFYAPGPDADRVRWGLAKGSMAYDTTATAVKGDYKALAGDFDGDGASDIVWYGPGGIRDFKWAGTPGGRTFTGMSENLTGTYRPFVGDFDGNGVDDIFFYGPGTLPDRVRWGLAPGSFAFETTTVTISGEYVPQAGDFNGDGATDVLWYGPGPLPDVMFAGTRGARTFTALPEAVDGTFRPFVGDFDGNGVDDVFFYGPGAATHPIRWGRGRGSFASDTTDVSVPDVYAPLAGDVNGDGATDVTWYGPGDAPDVRWVGRVGSHTFTASSDDINGYYRPF